MLFIQHQKQTAQCNNSLYFSFGYLRPKKVEHPRKMHHELFLTASLYVFCEKFISPCPFGLMILKCQVEIARKLKKNIVCVIRVF